MPDGIIDQYIEPANDRQGSRLRDIVGSEHVPTRMLHVRPLFRDSAERHRILTTVESMALRDQLTECLIDVMLPIASGTNEHRHDLRQCIDEPCRGDPGPRFLLD